MSIEKMLNMKKKFASTCHRINMKAFSDDTTVHGMKELYYSKKKVWKVLWIVTMIAATGLTVYQVTKSVEQYIDQPMITTIQPVENGKLLYPPLSLCYKHWTSWVDWKKVISYNISKSTLYFGLSYLGTVFSENAFDFRESEANFKTLMVLNNWTYLTQFYLAIAYDSPSSLTAIDGEGFTKRGFDLAGEVWLNFFCYTVESQHMKNFMDKQKSNSRLISLEVKKFPNAVPFDIGYMTLNEYTQSIKHAVQNDYSLERYEKMNDSDIIKLFNQQILLANYENDPLWLNSAVDSYIIKFRISVSKWQTKNTAPCVEHRVTNPADVSCKLKCNFLNFSQVCTTVPFWTAFLVQEDIPSLTCRQNITFFKNGRLDSESVSFETEFSSMCHCSYYDETNRVRERKLSDCLSMCLDGCEKWDFDVSIHNIYNYVTLPGYANRLETSIQVEFPTERSILVISEIDSQSWESFVANVGGLLGIWLGASIVSFFQTIYLCCFSELKEEGIRNTKAASFIAGMENQKLFKRKHPTIVMEQKNNTCQDKVNFTNIVQHEDKTKQNFTDNEGYGRIFALRI